MIRGRLVSLLVLIFTSCAYSSCGGDDGSCIYKGLTYTNNEIFTVEGQSKCIKFICNNTVIDIHEAGCEMNDECYAEGESTTSNCNTYVCHKIMIGDEIVFKMEITGDRYCNVSNECKPLDTEFDVGCSVYKCASSGASWTLETVSRKCNVSNQCRPLDTEFDTGCNVYKCASSGSSWSLEHVAKKCNVSNQCRPLDTEFDIGCNVYKCASSGSSWSLEQVAKKCNISGVCRPLDTNFDIGCTVYKCATTGTSWNLVQVAKKCPGANGTCHAQGESFPYPPYGTCQCSIGDDSKVSYSCQPN